MIIILGMAGAGKSTQCKLLSKDGDFQWLPVGELLRGQETGPERAEMMRGKVLDDSIVTPIVKNKIQELTDSPEILLDGCPRTLGQAQWLASATDTPVVRCVIHMVISDDAALERLQRRGREDDTDEAVRRRFAGYHRDIGPVLQEFKDHDIRVIEVDAGQDVEVVFNHIKGAL